MFASIIIKEFDTGSLKTCNSAYSSTSSFRSLASATRPEFRLGDFDILKHLGNGASGVVFLARHKQYTTHQPPLALKVIPKKGRSQATRASVLAEQRIQAMLTITDPGMFVPLIISWHDRSNYYLATEYMPGRDLAIELMRCKKFEPNRVRFYMAELVVALARLHERRIIFRDLKPANIMLDKDGHLFLGDFGVARWFDFINEERCSAVTLEDGEKACILSDNDPEGFWTTADYGTPLFMAPEQHAGESHSFAVDIWALGVTMFRMLTGRMPFAEHAADKQAIAQHVICDELPFGVTDSIDEVTMDLLHRLLRKNPRERIRIDQALEHPYFHGIDWQLASSRRYEAPWRPFVPPIPTTARTEVPIQEGKAYRAHKDRFPSFTWQSPALHQQAAKENKPRKCGLFAWNEPAKVLHPFPDQSTTKAQVEYTVGSLLPLWIRSWLGLKTPPDLIMKV